MQKLIGSDNYKSSPFYVVIDAETFVNLEFGPSKKEFDNKGYLKAVKELKNEKRKLIGMISYENVEGAVKIPQSFQMKNRNSIDKDPQFEADEDLEDEKNDEVKELPQSNSLQTETSKPMRHSVSITSESNQLLFRNKPNLLLKRSATVSNKKNLFYEKVKNSYAMEFFPQNFESLDENVDKIGSELRRKRMLTSMFFSAWAMSLVLILATKSFTSLLAFD